MSAIGFYNLENLFDTLDDARNPGDNDFTPSGKYRYTGEVYRQKLANLSRVLDGLGRTPQTVRGPALIGVAEVENERVLDDLVHTPLLQGRHLRVVHFDGPDPRGIDVGFLYDPGQFRLLAAASVPVVLPASMKGDGRTRDILLVQGIVDPDTVYALVNHWPSRRGGERASAPGRALAAAVCRRIKDSVCGLHPGARIVILGDLNDDPVSPSVVKSLGARGSPEALDGCGLFNPWVSFYKRGLGTLAYRDRWSLFDQIILSASWLAAAPGHWQFRDAAVYNPGFLKNRYGKFEGYPHRSFEKNKWADGFSDHFPTVIYIQRE